MTKRNHSARKGPTAVAARIARAEAAPRDPLELAWAAGFFDGEGTAYARANRRGHRHLRLTVKQARHPSEVGMPSVLERFRAALQLGAIGGPYADPGNRRPTYQWYAISSEALAAAAALWPYLSAVKRDQLAAAIHGLRQDSRVA